MHLIGTSAVLVRVRGHVGSSGERVHRVYEKEGRLKSFWLLSLSDKHTFSCASRNKVGKA